MDDAPVNPAVDETAPVPTVPGGAPTRGSRAWVRTVVLLAVGLVALGFGLETVSSSPRVCASCHEMSARVASWSRSGHSGVACVTCHQTPRPWYALPWKLADRTRLLARDMVAHTSGDYADSIDWRVAGKPMSDSVCLQCHNPNRKATSGYRITIDHVAHAKRNGSCVSCHVRTAHPVDTRGAALTLMSACFTCHGTARTAKAPGRCDLCHPSGYELKPASHKAAPWKNGHGKVALADLKQCELCHARSTCDACHGIEMPHPMGWSKGRPGHGDAAKKDRTVCAKCHNGTPDMCAMCHHTAFVPAKGTWREQHASDVRKRGSAFCLDCHGEQDCVRCHMQTFVESGS